MEQHDQRYNRIAAILAAKVPGVMPTPSKIPPDVVSRLRTLAHDLSNSIETIMQASYLLGQLKLEAPGKTWVTLIEDAAQDAAHHNRELREILRTQA